MVDAVPDLDLSDLSPEQRTTLAEAAIQAVWIPRSGTVFGVRLLSLDAWHFATGCGGVPLIHGTAIQPDGPPRRVTTVSVLLEDRLVWTPLGWLDLAPSPDLAEVAREAELLDHITRWCAALRRALLDT